MRKFLAALFLALSICSCRMVGKVASFIHDDQVVARAGAEKLYLSELEKYIPDFSSPEDSARMARQYIESWATDVLFMDLAQSRLSKEGLDVSSELESYRKSLLKYRYEQCFVEERLDTAVSGEQIKQYYKDNPESFVLERPLLKVRFVDVLKNSPAKDEILKMMSSEDDEVLRRVDTLASTDALKYYDSSSRWMDAAELARDFGLEYRAMLSLQKDHFIQYSPDGSPDIKAAYVCEIVSSGIVPIEYCEPLIREVILNSRKHDLISSLERDLLDDALKHKKFVIF